MNTDIYFESDGDLSDLNGKQIVVIGYGNVAKAMALNMRDNNLELIIAPQNETLIKRALGDGFQPSSIPNAVNEGDIILILVPDHTIPAIYHEQIQPYLKSNATLAFASGYSIVFDNLEIPNTHDVVLISPRIPGIGIREKFLKQESFFSLVGIHNNASGLAKQIMLALTKAIGGLGYPAVKVTFKQQTVLHLFTEQTFTYALSQILMRSVVNLIKNNYPPEAIMVELLLSGEGGYTLEKGIEVGMIKQMNFHSQTSQYGQMSRAIKFRGVGGEVERIQRQILREIETGDFTKEWDQQASKILLQVMQYYNAHTQFAKIEKRVRNNLGFQSVREFKFPELPEKDEIVNLGLENEVERIKAFYREV